MKLNVVKPESEDLGEALGIHPERQLAISAYLDALVKSDRYPRRGALVMAHNVFVMVLEVAETPEEQLYATLLHMQWLRKKGALFVDPRSLAAARI